MEKELFSRDVTTKVLLRQRLAINNPYIPIESNVISSVITLEFQL